MWKSNIIALQVLPPKLKLQSFDNTPFKYHITKMALLRETKWQLI